MIKESDSCAAQDKALIRAKFARFVNPNRLDVWKAAGIDLIIGQREGYKFRDLSGAEYHDVHLNGGTFNLGHRHPEVVSAMLLATESLDVGNHHFAAQSRADLAERLSELCPGLQYSVFATGGSETNDIAIKASRWVTGRRKVVSLEQGYHGRTGISGAAGDDSSARYFNSDDPQNFIKVPFDDAEALARALADEDVACVILEPIPATCGFPIPSEGYFQAVRAACDATGTMLVADEIQTGLMRTGKMWAVEGFAVQPDILTTSKGLSGGMYPIGAAVLSASCGRWLEQSGWAHVNTFGGSEIGCEVALKALEIYSRPATLARVTDLITRMGNGLNQIKHRHGYLKEVRQCGLVIGLKFDDPVGGERIMKALFDRGVWAILADFDRSVLQFKPGLLISDQACDDILDRLESAIIAVARVSAATHA